jgi:DNA-binding transcriptional LysR family regulator
MDFLADYTEHVVGRTERSGIGGDPSPDTARTVLYLLWRRGGHHSPAAAAFIDFVHTR